MESGQFLQRLHLGGIAHPFQCLNAFAQTFLKIANQGDHAFLGLGREVFLHIHLAYSLAQRTAHHSHGTLPAGLHLLCATHGAAEEVEVFLGKIVAQHRGGIADGLPLQIKGLVSHRSGMQNLGSSLERSGLADDDFLYILEVHGGEESIPAKGGAKCLGLIHGHLVIVGMRITQLGTRAVCLCQTGFDVHYQGGSALGGSIVHASQFVHFLYMREEGCADALAVLGIFQIIVALAHAQANLIGLNGIHAAVFLISTHIHSHIGTHTTLLHLAQEVIQIFLFLYRSDLLQAFLQGSGSVLVQLHAVHGHTIERAYLLGNASGSAFLGGKFFNEPLNLGTVVLGQLVKRAEA